MVSLDRLRHIAKGTLDEIMLSENISPEFHQKIKEYVDMLEHDLVEVREELEKTVEDLAPNSSVINLTLSALDILSVCDNTVEQTLYDINTKSGVEWDDLIPLLSDLVETGLLVKKKHYLHAALDAYIATSKGAKIIRQYKNEQHDAIATNKLSKWALYCPCCKRWIPSKNYTFLPKHANGNDLCAGSEQESTYISHLKPERVTWENGKVHL